MFISWDVAWVLSHGDDISIIMAKDQLTNSNNDSRLLVPGWPVALTSSCFHPVAAPIGPMTRFPWRLSSWHLTLTWHHNTKYWSVFFPLPLLKDIERDVRCALEEKTVLMVSFYHTRTIRGSKQNYHFQHPVILFHSSRMTTSHPQRISHVWCCC